MDRRDRCGVCINYKIRSEAKSEKITEEKKQTSEKKAGAGEVLLGRG